MKRYEGGAEVGAMTTPGPGPAYGSGDGQDGGWQHGQGGGQGGGWEQRPPQPPPQAGAGRGLAITALVLGIVACVLFWTVIGGILLGLLAIAFGVVSVMRPRRGPSSGRGMAISGVVLGILALIGSSLILALGVALWNSDSVQDFKECLRQAQNDQERRACEVKFDKDIDKNYG